MTLRAMAWITRFRPVRLRSEVGGSCENRGAYQPNARSRKRYVPVSGLSDLPERIRALPSTSGLLADWASIALVDSAGRDPTSPLTEFSRPGDVRLTSRLAVRLSRSDAPHPGVQAGTQA